MWAAPSDDSLTDFGDAITGYNIWIQTSVAGVWEQDMTNCPGTDPAITECTFSLFDLMAEPYNLPENSQVFAKVSAYNTIGESPASDASPC